jgi:hypothetical protein
MGAFALVVGGSALLGSARLVQAWEAGLRRGDFGDLPLPLLILLTAAVLVSAPLALIGLSALAFAEERIEVGPERILIERTAFERTRTDFLTRAQLECWRETYWPLPPWWTWSVRRLAARGAGRLYPIAAAAGPRQKREIGRLLAEATGKPLLGPRGKPVPARD